MVGHIVTGVIVHWYFSGRVISLVLHVSRLILVLIVAFQHVIQQSGFGFGQIILLAWVIDDVIQTVRVTIWTFCACYAGKLQWVPPSGGLSPYYNFLQ